MHFNTSIFFILYLTLVFSLSAQDDYYGLEEDEKTSRFYYGFNLGGYFASPNSTIIYNGSPNSTIYGINYIFNQPFNQQTFDNYFVYPFRVVEYPLESESRYQVSAELGLHLDYRISRYLSMFIEINTVVLDYEQFFTVAIDDPFNRAPGPIFRQLPIIGEERRININLGTQVSYYEKNGTNAYFAISGNVNNTTMQRNYIVVDGINYDIFHETDDNRLNARPGGLGYGFGAGTGLKFNLSEHILGDLFYHLNYTKAYMTEEFQPFGYNHSIGIRLLWN